jgi:hypothetical protein
VTWLRKRSGGRIDDELLGGEYEVDPETGEGAWLVLDVAGHVICDSRPRERAA